MQRILCGPAAFNHASAIVIVMPAVSKGSHFVNARERETRLRHKHEKIRVHFISASEDLHSQFYSLQKQGLDFRYRESASVVRSAANTMFFVLMLSIFKGIYGNMGGLGA
ncbi:hypothetical protein MPTK2_8g05290 [Marchantia polymorpha subsp. ruderalis]